MEKSKGNGRGTRDIEKTGKKTESFRVERSFAGAGKGEPYQIQHGFGFVTDDVRRELACAVRRRTAGSFPSGGMKAGN